MLEQTSAVAPHVAVGSGLTVKVAALVELPSAEITVTVPVVPDPTVTVSEVAVCAVIAAAVPPIVTDVTVSRPEPLITRDDPTHPVAAARLVITGAATGVKFPASAPISTGVRPERACPSKSSVTPTDAPRLSA